MQLVDANVLLYAVNESASNHAAARRWLEDALTGPETVGFTWVVMLAFLRLSTRQGVFPRPLSPATATGVLERWLAQPGSAILAPSERHMTLLNGLLAQAGTAGNLVNDAHLAALALEHGAEVVSFDRDFARFEGVHRHEPGQGDAATSGRRPRRRLAAEPPADVVYTTLSSPFGELTAAATEHGLVRLAFPEEPLEEVLERLSLKLSPRIAENPSRFEQVRRELDEYFVGTRRDFMAPLDRALMNDFAKRVLAATAAIPYGSVSTYADMAAAAGSPSGARAAGNALGSNPIPVIVPCHRVLHSTGGLGGYGGGLDRKRWLLELEGALTPQGSR
jgi:toxin-antitoxin system PIN domain toxin